MRDDSFPPAFRTLTRVVSPQVSPTTELVGTRIMNCEAGFPLLMEPLRCQVNLAEWIGAQMPKIENILCRHGAILFRGFQIDSREAFAELLAAAGQTLLGYEDQHTPRTTLGNNIFTSTEYPANQNIPFHSENSKDRSWPRKIWFCSVETPTSGGETPIADNRKVASLLSASLLDRFVEKGVLYVRNYGGGLGLSWQQAFQVNARTEAEAYCRQHAMSYEWPSETHLRVRHLTPALAEHPETGERLWFNQAHLFHWSSLPEPIYRSLLESVGAANLPSNSFYGDGSEISGGVIEEITRAYEDSSVRFPWLKGDVLLLDNMLIAHGRAPYAGSRRVLVGMTERYTPSETVQLQGNV